VRTVPRLCEVYRGIRLTTEKKEWRNLSQGSRRVPVGTMKTEYTEQSIQTIRIHKHNNKNTQLTELNKNIQNLQQYTQR
jgi:hypothetical protein